ncbi:spore germination protein [Paenibacillus sp. YPG26]|uniref:spore germination protein n=1 Tax=Paenibacillus sp. YPG26 TaxID=2878915 RepID=UPI00203EC384|nr:spore germination protein [Paenibacillus sp. YPG26]USB35074.1 spore germination protein [Paenibacillus sp. YPG26]
MDKGSHGRHISPVLSDKLAMIQQRMGNSSDFITREIKGSSDASYPFAICYIDGLIDQTLLTDLMESLTSMLGEPRQSDEDKNPGVWLKNKLPAGNLNFVHTEDEMLRFILEGQVLVMIHGVEEAYAVSIPGGFRRAVEEPTSQTVVRGPKEGFTEDISTNISLIRRRIRSSDLRFESRTVGEYTQTKISVAYMNGIADPEVVKEVLARIDKIQTDSILESGYIEEFIQDGVRSTFPTIYNTERPDTVAGGLLEGLVAILVDGTPFTLIAPVTFFRFIVSSEDYYQRYDLATFLRIIRFVSFFVALLLPSVYIATTTFHQEMLPTTLLIALAGQRENTPLPALLEALVMEVTFEVIREAGVRMPRAIGPAISIVGALVLGQAAVQAGIVSAAMVIVVSFTAISNFVLPAINMAAAVRLLRFVLMFLAGSLGLFGILAGLVPILAHMASLQSFGVPYLMPLAPFNKTNLKDFIIRAPWWRIKTRPVRIGDQNRMRQADKPKSFAQQATDKSKDPM